LSPYKNAGYETLILREDKVTIRWLETNPPGKIFIFDHNLWENLAVIRYLKDYSSGCIVVLYTGKVNYKFRLYQEAGADYVLYTNELKLEFLFPGKPKTGKGDLYE
jgi:hypothetical protein